MRHALAWVRENPECGAETVTPAAGATSRVQVSATVRTPISFQPRRHVFRTCIGHERYASMSAMIRRSCSKLALNLFVRPHVWHRTDLNSSRTL